ncbi:MAG: SGNH/GDSL hydrolase family protein [Verrucomicrobiaceae bacterium]|nr:SGNH/GDSL hydrolase family protein [Verrucomicrobiaceae bacterium]
MLSAFRSLSVMSLLVLAEAFVFAADPVANKEDYSAFSPAKECRPRDGWPHFFKKAQTPGTKVKVGYLGGSITAQQGWRPKSLALLKERFPNAQWSEINAAIGGTGSDLGVARLKQDVLDQQPDLLLVEFAVNDGGSPPEQIKRCMEGIVRQTWAAYPECDIGFVYTLTEALAPAMVEGHFQRSASAMEEVADHYGVPTIHMAMEVAKLAKEGRLVWRAPLPKSEDEKKALGDKFVFAPDSVHPHVETGHELYKEAVARGLDEIMKVTKAPSGPHTLKQPLMNDHYAAAKMLALKPTMLKGFEPLDMKTHELGKRFANRMSQLFFANQPGSTLQFKFKGTRCALYQVIGPDVGKVTVSLDGKETSRTAFDSYCTYHRLSTMMIGDLLTDEIHNVKITLDAEAPDKAKILSARNETIKDPTKFAVNGLYAGALLLVGEIVE